MRLAARLCLALSLCLTLTGCQTLSTRVSATAKPPGSPVAVVGGPYAGMVGTAVNFSASKSSDPQNLPLTYAWDFGDGAYGSGVAPTHTYTGAGIYTVSVTVTDTDNLSATASTTATISAIPPPAVLPPVAVPGGPYTGTAGFAIDFDGSLSSDPQGQTLTYAWNFGDGGTATGPTPSHTYAAGNTFTVTLTVTNTSGLTNSASTAALVAPPLPPATAGTRLYQAVATQTSSTTWASSVVVYPAGVSGSVTPILTLTSPNTTDMYQSIGTDPYGNVYVTAVDSSTKLGKVLILAPPAANGVVIPIRTIAGANTQLVNVGQPAVDNFGNVYVVSLPSFTANASANILEFSAGAGGNVVPIRTFTTNGGFSSNPLAVSIAIDQNMNVVVCWHDNTASNQIQFFTPAQSGAATPVRTILPSGQVSYFDGVALDPAGNIYASIGTVSGFGVVEFTGGINPNTSNTPINTINIGLVGELNPGGFAVDSVGNIYETRWFPNTISGTLLWIPAGSTGSVTPLVETTPVPSPNLAVH